MAAVVPSVSAAELAQLGEHAGLDVVGAAPVAPYTDTERHIAVRQARGLFGALRFTMARPERSCHPERVMSDARTVVAGALCTWEDAPEPRPGEGRLPRHAWRDAYAELRDRLAELGEALGGTYRVLVDDNDHVDREAAVRAGLGFYGKNTMVITRAHGSWVVLGTLLTTVEIESTPQLRAGCGSCTLCIEACPTDAIVEPGVLDATRCLSTWTQAPSPMPAEVMDALGDRVYGCDICQDVCPWNTGVALRRAGTPPAEGTEPVVPLADWLALGGTPRLAQDVDRLFVPRNDPRWLVRNALVALGNTGDRAHAALARPYAEGSDELLRVVARRALERIAERTP